MLVYTNICYVHKCVYTKTHVCILTSDSWARLETTSEDSP